MTTVSASIVLYHADTFALWRPILPGEQCCWRQTQLGSWLTAILVGFCESVNILTADACNGILLTLTHTASTLDTLLTLPLPEFCLYKAWTYSSAAAAQLRWPTTRLSAESAGLLFLTPVLEKLPNNALATIVVAGLVSIFDYEEAIWLWKVGRPGNPN